MPVILAPDAYARWLDPGADPEELRAMLVPYPAETMVAHAVGRLVNDPKHDDPRRVEPAG